MAIPVASTFRFALRAVLLALFLLAGLYPVLWVINRYRRRDTPADMARADALGVRLANWLLWFFGVRVRARGKPADAPVLVAANHKSWLDILALHADCAMDFVAKAEIEQWPVFSFVARTGGSIFHQRGSQDSATDVVAAMVRRLNEGRRVAIFPEGGILPGEAVQTFHARMFRAAVDAGCPVQPVMVRYLRDGRRDDEVLFRENESMLANLCRLLARPGSTADVLFLPPIDSAGQPRRALAEATRAVIVSSYESEAELRQ